MKPIYLDNAATTPLANEVVKTLKEELNNFLANPSSSHFLGKKAKVKILNAKKSIGDFFNIKPEEIIFTSGATEALNTCIKGFYNLLKKPHIITTDIEHPAVFNTIKHLEENGADVTYLKCPNGYPELKDIENAIQDNTKLFVFSYVNSETGIVSDIDNIANLAKENDIALIVDAAQALGKIDFNITDGISAMCFSGHKIHATSGIGFFYLNSKYKISPLLLGGTQEYKKRAGTENILGIIALKTAINILLKKQKEDILHLSKIQHHFENALKSKLNIKINGFDVKRSPHISNIAFLDILAEDLLTMLEMKQIVASTGSACSSGSLEISKILLNIGISPKEARSSIRFSFSRNTTLEDINIATNEILNILRF